MRILENLKVRFALPAKDLKRAKGLFFLEKFQKGDFYLKVGSKIDKISFIEEGLFKLFYNLDGEERIMLFFSENQFMTDYFAYLTESPSIRPIQALENSIVYTIKRQDLNHLFNTSQSWEHIGRLLAESAYLTSVHRANRLLHDGYETRLQTFIQENPTLIQRVPQYMIASYLNMTPETLSRVKKRLMENGSPGESVHDKL